MTLLADTNVILILCLILTFDLKSSCGSSITITIAVFDSSGIISSLPYEGGIAVIYCVWKSPSNKTIKLQVANGTPSDFVTLKAGSDPQHTVSISSAELSNIFKCVSGNEQSETVEITYALCSRKSVTPRSVCPKAQEFCHITKTDSTKCETLSEYSCFYGHDHNSHTVVDSQVRKFPVLCHDNATNGTRGGLCYSLSLPNVKRPRFLATTDENQCSNEFNVYVCNNDCDSSKKQLEMAGWDFIDLEHSTSIYASIIGESLPLYNLKCETTYDGTPGIHRVSWEPLSNRASKPTTIFTFKEQVKQLSTPTIADIRCTAFKHSHKMTYQTYLLLFRSYNDWFYEIAKIESETAFGQIIHKITIRVSAERGLYVCARGHKTRCIPKVPNNTQMIDVFVSYEKGKWNYTITFYVRIFASSPKKKYVLVYEDVVNRKIQVPERNNATRATHEYHTNNSGGIAGTNATICGRLINGKNEGQMNNTIKMTKDSRWNAGFTVTVVVVTILAITAMTIVTVLVLWFMNRSARKRKSGCL